MAVAVGHREAPHRDHVVRAAVLRAVGSGRRVAMKKIRWAIYTRKSSEDGLEHEFNSLQAQREACAAYIASQKNEGWVMLPDACDDGGLSGGSLERRRYRDFLTTCRRVGWTRSWSTRSTG